MKLPTFLLVLPITGLFQSCAKKNPEPAIETVHDTVNIVRHPAWTDTFVGRYQDDNGANTEDQLALLHYTDTGSIIFEMKIAANGEHHVFNVKTASFPIFFHYIAPDSIDLTGGLYSSGGGIFNYNARKKR